MESDENPTLIFKEINETSEILRRPSYDCVSNINFAKLAQW